MSGARHRTCVGAGAEARTESPRPHRGAAAKRDGKRIERSGDESLAGEESRGERPSTRGSGATASPTETTSEPVPRPTPSPRSLGRTMRRGLSHRHRLPSRRKEPANPARRDRPPRHRSLAKLSSDRRSEDAPRPPSRRDPFPPTPKARAIRDLASWPSCEQSGDLPPDEIDGPPYRCDRDPLAEAVAPLAETVAPAEASQGGVGGGGGGVGVRRACSSSRNLAHAEIPCHIERSEV